MAESKNTSQDLKVIILAAGLGTRMKSERAKVLHELAGKPLIAHVIDGAMKLSPEKIYVVIGHQGEQVREVCTKRFGESLFEFVPQTEQLGTGHAVNCVRDHLENDDSTVLVLSGDVPMIGEETLSSLISTHDSYKSACTILSVVLPDPSGYGRIVRDYDAGFVGIVEQKDADEKQLQIEEVNTGIYCFDSKKLFKALSKIGNKNAQGEYYLTDVPAIMLGDGEKVAVSACSDPAEVEGVLAAHPAVERVAYPFHSSHPQHGLAREQMSGGGGMITIVLRGGLPAARHMLERTRLFSLAESLGGVESLIEHPAIMTHASIPVETRRALGISDGLVRLSVGIEGLHDLVDDLDRALNGVPR